MANIYGSFSGESSARVRPYIAWSYTQNAAGNYSDVTTTLYFESISAYYGHGTSTNTTTQAYTVSANNGSIAFNVAARGSDMIVSNTHRVYHDANGYRTGILINSSGSTNIYWGTYNFGAYVDLAAITRVCTVTSTAASSIGGTSATTGGNVTDAGLPLCTERGVYWGTTVGSQPNKVTSGSGAGAFSANIAGLERGTQYFFKAYAYNSSGYVYGSVLNFTTTAAAPSVTTETSSSVTYNSATVTGTLADDNGAAVTEKGICYSTTTNPTTASSKVTSGTGEGAISSNLTSLTPNTTYYAKAYGINSVGTSYGAEISFTTTTAEPTVTTTAGATGITTSVATVAGNVTSDNGSAITERGFVYALTANPTTANSKAVTTGTTGAMSKEITGLSIATLYHFRAFATNAQGTGYGSDQTFTTLPGDPSALSATVTDKDKISLTWTKGNGGTYTIIRRGATAPANINSGTLVYQGTGSSFIDTGLTSGTLYYYRAWSATTADWSVAYSSSYSADSETTQYDFTNPNNALVDDTNAATVPANDNKLYAQVSRDGGTTWSNSRELTFTTVSTQSFGSGTTELWGMMTWNGGHMSDTNFKVRLTGGSLSKSYEVFKTFGFNINANYILTGVQVQVKAAWDNTDLLVYFIKVDTYYGDSPLPIGQGSLAYDTTLDRPTYYDGGDWTPIGGGSKVTVSETAPSDPKFGDIWIDISSD